MHINIMFPNSHISFHYTTYILRIGETIGDKKGGRYLCNVKLVPTNHTLILYYMGK